MSPKPSLIEEGFMAYVAPNGDGVDEHVMLHPEMLVVADGFVLLRELERVWGAQPAEDVAGGRKQNVVTALLVLGEKVRRAVRIGRVEGDGRW